VECQNGECLEIALGDRGVALRDFSDPASLLVITREAFDAMRANAGAATDEMIDGWGAAQRRSNPDSPPDATDRERSRLVVSHWGGLRVDRGSGRAAGALDRPLRGFGPAHD
jgi:hypothetical protein